ncbi:myb-like protein X [Senna tora]|uniref:Myb-like protein X n=1 Tax=Senna tora TaxID=362788 RepID=A0A834TWD2_9FABA|nr:myb-like protein X [Senna tora]
MESEDDIELLPSSPVHERKLKRLKKVVRVPENPRRNTLDNVPSMPHANSSESDSLHSISDNPNVIDFDELNVGSGPAFDSTGDENGLSTELDASERFKEDGLGAMSVLEFDSVAAEDLGGNVEACSMEAEKVEEVGDVKTEELQKKRRSVDSFSEKREKKKKRSDGEKVKESTSNKRKAEKSLIKQERQDNLRQLRAESQRLLRETRDAAFKSIPLARNPISSILGKIRQRKLEVFKKSSSFIDDIDDGYARDVLVDDVSEHACLGDEIIDKVENGERQETFTSPADMKINLDASQIVGSADAANCSTSESSPCPVAVGSESDHEFRAPIDDTQEIYSNSQRSDARDEALNELNSPLEVFEPSIPTMNLKLDSAPPDDVSSDEEDNDKENTDPHPHGSADLSPPSGDPVKAFVDEEAEEEDNSDNDLMRFQEDEDDDEDDAEELNNMIATEFEENLIDRERRDQLHQQWLEQQDAAGMDNLLQKLNCGSKLRDTSIDEEEDEESNETENESENEVEEYAAQPNAARINLEKVKQMIPQMFTDKDDAYVSSDDEETEKRLAKQCLFDRTEEQATFLSPAEDEGCREVFSLIKKLNIVPDTKRKGRTASFLDTPLIGQNINISSKSSFLNRASNHSMPSSQKRGPNKARSFIFGRDDSNSRTSITMSEDSSDTIQRESQLPKTVRAKFKSNTQNKYNALNSASEKSGTSLLEILRKSSLHAERRVRNDVVQQTESAFAAFKLTKKPIKTEGRV